MRLSTIASFLFITLTASSRIPISGNHLRKTCTVTPLGDNQNDVPSILHAFKECNNGGRIIFPENATYWIAERLKPHVHDVEIEWRGTWLFSDNLSYWRNNSYPIEFQNHAAGFILSGSGISIDGHGMGSINGNGDLWYTDEAGVTQPGRPMPFVLWNTTNARISNFEIIQPQLWSINIMNGHNIHLDNITVSAISSREPDGENWTQNTDGFDTADSTNITLRNFTYTGKDDCIAIKPRSFNLHLTDITCNGGNGIAIGSLGQYLEDASVGNITISHARVPGTRYGTYIKTWMGELVPQDSYESGGQPRGGGWGWVRDITFEDIDVTNSQRAVVVTQDNGNDGTNETKGTSKMGIEGVRFVGYRGVLDGSNEVTVECSTVYPCDDISFKDWRVEGEDGDLLGGRCKWTAEDGVTGLVGCR